MDETLKILVTGGYGFIGSNFINWYLDTLDNIIIYNIDFRGVGSNPKNINPPKKDTQKIININEDINNIESVLGGINDFDFIYHFAAESHVDRSIKSPDAFVKSNVNGTLALLEFHRKQKKCRLVMVSTDEVYGSIEKGSFKETDILNPSSPYSASKAAAELLCNSYVKTYGSDIIITRCANNFGPNQYEEKLIPVVVNKILRGEKIPVYDDGEQSREWTFVNDHIEDIIIMSHFSKKGETYNVGKGIELKNIELIKLINSILAPNKEPNIEFIKNGRLGHDYRYSINLDKIDKFKKRMKMETNPNMEDFHKNLKEVVIKIKDEFEGLEC